MNVEKHLHYKVLDCTTTVMDNPLENIRIDICIEKTFLNVVLSSSESFNDCFHNTSESTLHL